MRDAVIESVVASAFRIPTDAPEADGTFEWSDTTLVLVEVTGGGVTGLGYTYADASAALAAKSMLAPAVAGLPALQTGAAWRAMMRALRNNGQRGIGMMALSAVDVALWDLKGKLLGLSVADLLGPAHDSVRLYGSGGFTSYSPEQLTAQLAGWAGEGFGAVKMKTGSRPEKDLERVETARAAIGPDVELFVDANGALSRKQALAFAEDVAPLNVSWFEEPVTSDDLEGLRLLRDRAPSPMAISAGEYGYDLSYFRQMLTAGAVDVLQADATRCGGITGFLKVAALAEAFAMPLSSHCAPALHVHPCAAAGPVVHMEWFHDHARIEGMLFDGASEPEHGALRPPIGHGLGLGLRRDEAEQYRVAVSA